MSRAVRREVEIYRRLEQMAGEIDEVMRPFPRGALSDCELRRANAALRLIRAEHATLRAELDRINCGAPPPVAH